MKKYFLMSSILIAVLIASCTLLLSTKRTHEVKHADVSIIPVVNPSVAAPPHEDDHLASGAPASTDAVVKLRPDENATLTSTKIVAREKVGVQGTGFDKGLNLKTDQVTFDGHKVITKTIMKLGAILNCPEGTSAYGTRIAVSRDKQILNLRISSPHGAAALNISGEEFSISNLTGDFINGIEAINSDYSDFESDRIRVTPIRNRTTRNMELAITGKKGRKLYPLGEFTIGNDTLAHEFRYGVTIKQTAEHEPVSILVLDFDESCIAAEVPLPMNLPRGRPISAIDSKTGCIVTFDADLNWCVVLDVSK